MITDNNGKTYMPKIIQNGKVKRFTLGKNTVSAGIEYIEFTDSDFCASSGADGYYTVADVNKQGSYLCRFDKKEDQEVILKQNLMPISGIKKENYTALIIAVGMKNCFYVRIGVKDNKYTMALRFVLDKNEPYEDISFEIHRLNDDADYNDMAREYRKYQLDRGACVPIKERIKNNPALKYAAESVEIRIRMGWKPAPPTVIEQTVKNEPEMHVACTFDRVKDIIDELKKQGVDKAQLCLVGWNKSGHDGRWPQTFPVEDKLGGEKKLKELIRHAQDNGCQIVCHTNSTDWYNIAEGYSKDECVIKNADGSYAVNDWAWSGGKMYNLCPIKAYEIAKETLPRVAGLGFFGLHYIDVMSVEPLRRCYDKNHPVTEKDTEEIFEKIAEMSHKLFGGFASEGAFDFAAPYLDYAYYVAGDGDAGSLFDVQIPLWQLVYHGIILSNPTGSTTNYTIKDKKTKEKVKAYGGRPSFYFNVDFYNFDKNDEARRKKDLLCDTDENLRYSVSKIKEAYEEFKEQRHLQLEFMEKYIFEENGTRTEYSDGSVCEILQ